MTTGVLDKFENLVMVRAEGSSEVHLAPDLWQERTDTAALCGRPILGSTTHENFSRHGCMPCAQCALTAGIDKARQTPQVTVNLRRFVERRPVAAAAKDQEPTAGSGSGWPTLSPRM